MFNNKIITATQLNNSNTELIKIVEDKLTTYVNQIIRKKVREANKLHRIELNDDKAVLSDEVIENIKLTAITDEEINNKRIEFLRNFSEEKNNYKSIRKDLHNLNDLWYDSVEIEKHGLQRYEELLSYDDLVLHSTNLTFKFYDILKVVKEEMLLKLHKNKDEIHELINSRSFSGNVDSMVIDLLLKMREMYTVTFEMDDFELFERYELKSNIEYANELSKLLSYYALNGDSNHTLLNALSSDNVSIKVNREFLAIRELLINKGISNVMLAKFFGNETISNNRILTFENMYVTNKNFDSVYKSRTMGEILFEITNEKLQFDGKDNRQQIYMTYGTNRPSKDDYYQWNGLQIFDLDLKGWIAEYNGDIALLKEQLYEDLKQFHWFAWICFSARGRGLHIYTKVTPPHHVYTHPNDNNYLSEYYHQVNYLTKQSVIYDIILKHNNYARSNSAKGTKFERLMFPINDDGISNKYLDNSVARITSGIRLAFDTHPFINENFVDLHLGWALGQTFSGYEDIEKINNLLLRNTKLRTNINDELAIENIAKYRIAPEIDLSKYITLGLDIEDTKTLPRNNINYVTRYNICNTLASIFGKDGLEIAHNVLDSKGCRNVGEINSFYSCALSNNKQPTKLGLELLKKIGIIKNIDDELVEIVDESFRGNLAKEIMDATINDEEIYSFKLSKTQYLGHIKDSLLGTFTNDKLNILLANAGLGKTQLIKQLAKEGNRIMLVLPYRSIITNKIIKDESITELFDVVQGSTSIDDIEYGRNVVCTFDKFSRTKYEKISRMYDYIFIDESHLMFTSSYRINATSNMMKRIKELFFVSSNDRLSAKVVLLTGTETGELHFFNRNANVIRVSKPSLEKNMEFMICADGLDAITKMSKKITEYILNGYRILIPTNKGEIYSEKIIGMVEHLLDRSVKYGYYKRSNNEQEICRLINNNDTIGDYEIVFCTNYLSVGVDIVDQHKFASMYLGDYAGYEIEQFNARIRRTGIDSFYCIITEKANGEIRNDLLEEPNLVLHLTDSDKLHFLDDKNISDSKVEFMAKYDSVLHKITTAGFSLFQGKIQFNLDEYELITFEEKYNLCMEHPVKVARELAKYGYNITVSKDYVGFNKSEQDSLKKMGLESAKEEKVRKHNLMVGTYIDLIKCNTFVSDYGLEFNNVIEYIYKNLEDVIEDRELMCDESDTPQFVKVIFDIMAQPIRVIVRSKEALDKMIKQARYLASRYTETRAIELLYNFVDDNGIIRQKQFQRSINLSRLIEKSDMNELSDALSKTIEDVYALIDRFERKKGYSISYDSYTSILETFTYNYIDMVGIKINTKYGFEKIRDSIEELINDMSTKQRIKGGQIRLVYNKLPDQDSTTVLNRRSIDTLVVNMFSVLDSNRQVSSSRERHVIELKKQEF